MAPPADGNVQFSLSFGEEYSAVGTADVTWTKFEDLGDTRRYVPSGTITADMTLASNCDTLHVTAPIWATVPNDVGPTLVVYTATNAAYANRYQFSLAAAEGTVLEFTCYDSERKPYTVQSPVPLAFGVGLCGSSFDFPTFTNEAELAGTYSCPITGINSVTWDFSK